MQRIRIWIIIYPERMRYFISSHTTPPFLSVTPLANHGNPYFVAICHHQLRRHISLKLHLQIFRLALEELRKLVTPSLLYQNSYIKVRSSSVASYARSK